MPQLKHLLFSNQEVRANVVRVNHVRSTLSPFKILQGYRVTYPPSVITALGLLLEEYNTAFGPLVAKNREGAADYQYCMWNGNCVNYAVQIDMVGLNDVFLTTAAGVETETVSEVLRRCVFEIENSLAMYQLLERLFSANGSRNTYFGLRFRKCLETLRQQYGRPIALLAVTQAKYDAMKASEFGKAPEEPLSPEEVYELSGFDHFFGPDDFLRHLQESGGCDYLLYARTSDPLSKLKKPSTVVDQPLLGDDSIRQVIKANVITMNVDGPHMDPACRINDTKAYMCPLGMAFDIMSPDDLLKVECREHLGAGAAFTDFHGKRLTDEFAAFLLSHGVNPDEVADGRVNLHAKPGQGTYGCYGHVSGQLNNRDFRVKLRAECRRRPGGYVIQPHIPTSTLTNIIDGGRYPFIDRVFFGMVRGQPQFLGGFRSCMPEGSAEAKAGRNHGNGDTVWAEIVG